MCAAGFPFVDAGSQCSCSQGRTGQGGWELLQIGWTVKCVHLCARVWCVSGVISVTLRGKHVKCPENWKPPQVSTTITHPSSRQHFLPCQPPTPPLQPTHLFNITQSLTEFQKSLETSVNRAGRGHGNARMGFYKSLFFIMALSSACSVAAKNWALPTHKHDWANL